MMIDLNKEARKSLDTKGPALIVLSMKQVIYSKKTIPILINDNQDEAATLLFVSTNSNVG